MEGKTGHKQHGTLDASASCRGLDRAPAQTPTVPQRLMKISRDDRLLNTTHASVLPASWGTLYELSRLGKDRVQRRIKAGEITPETTREQVKYLIDNSKWPKKPPRKEPPAPELRRVQELTNRLKPKDLKVFVDWVSTTYRPLQQRKPLKNEQAQ